LDILETSSRILSIASEGVSRLRIMDLHPDIRQDEIWGLLKTLENRNLLQMDSSSIYRTTINGIKFLEIHFNIEQLLQTRKSLV